MAARRKRLPKDLSTMVGDGENAGATQVTNNGVSRGKPQESNARMFNRGTIDTGRWNDREKPWGGFRSGEGDLF